MTMNHTWGFRSYDHDWKSAETARRLADINSNVMAISWAVLSVKYAGCVGDNQALLFGCVNVNVIKSDTEISQYTAAFILDIEHLGR